MAEVGCILGLCGDIGIMEKKMETTIVRWGDRVYIPYTDEPSSSMWASLAGNRRSSSVLFLRFLPGGTETNSRERMLRVLVLRA